MSDRCPTCDELIYEWRPPHECKPKWWCWHDDGDNGYYVTDDGGTLVFADDARAAAVEYCNQYPEHDGSWSETVVVKAHDRDEWVKVNAEASIEWHAGYEDPVAFTPVPPPAPEFTRDLARKVHPDLKEIT